jgi:complement component 1 Q subcomponent-binding protein
MSAALARSVLSLSARQLINGSKLVLTGRQPTYLRGISGMSLQYRSLSAFSCTLHKPLACPPNDLQLKRQLHTPGDKELVEFLKDEIKMEKQNQKTTGGKLPKIKGFEIVKTEGPNVTLRKTIENETITIKFSVNNSIDDSSLDMEVDPSQQQQQSDEAHDNTKMVSKPSFVVEISKGGAKALALQCVFPPSDEYPPAAEHDQAEPYEDLIEIQDVALLDKGQEWTDEVYSLSASVMDGNLYDMLMKLLEERGLDADFIDQLTEFSTSYEHSRYIDVLEQLKDFVASK